MIFAIDASGSIGAINFVKLRTFTGVLGSLFLGNAYGRGAVKLGLVVFGNGKLQSDPKDDARTAGAASLGGPSTAVSPAIKVEMDENHAQLTHQNKLWQAALVKQTWQRGLTNMAQAFSAAQSIFEDGVDARPSSAQQTIVVISDGKPSFVYDTGLSAKSARFKGIRIFIASTSPEDNNRKALLKAWVSKPKNGNFMWIGKDKNLDKSIKQKARKLMIASCPEATSPSKVHREEETDQWKMVFQKGYCISKEGIAKPDQAMSNIFHYERCKIAPNCAPAPGGEKPEGFDGDADQSAEDAITECQSTKDCKEDFNKRKIASQCANVCSGLGGYNSFIGGNRRKSRRGQCFCGKNEAPEVSQWQALKTFEVVNDVHTEVPPECANYVSDSSVNQFVWFRVAVN